MSQVNENNAAMEATPIPGINNQEQAGSPIPPPPGFEETQPQVEVTEEVDQFEAIRQRVQSRMQEFHDFMEGKLDYDPHPVNPVTVEEIDGVLADAELILASEPLNIAMASIKKSLLQMRNDIINEENNSVENPTETTLDAQQMEVAEAETADETANSIAALEQEQEERMQDIQIQQQQTATFNANPSFTPEPQSEVIQEDNPIVGIGEDPLTGQVTPVVEIEETAVVQEPQQPAPQPSQPKQKQTYNSFAALQRSQVRRADGGYNRFENMFPMSISNKSLDYLIKEWVKTGEVMDEATINGVIMRSNKMPGIWEEGGATPTAGYVLLVTDKDGRKPSPWVIFNHTDFVNGKQALIQVHDGYYLVLGGHRNSSPIVCVYRVDSTTTSQTEDGKDRAEYESTLIGYGTSAENFTLAVDSDPVWHKEHPALLAAFARMYEQNAMDPIYVRDYRQSFTNLEDLSSASQDQAFLATCVDKATVKEAYADINAVLAKHVAENIGKKTFKFPELVITINYLPDHNLAVAYLMGILFDTETKTSAANRLIYRRVILQPGNDTFYYPDRDEDQVVTYNDLVEYLTHNNNGIVSTFRRVTR